VFRSRASLVRPHRILGESIAAPRKDYAFQFELPTSLLPAAGADHDVRVFAVNGRLASEPRYAPGYPWGTGAR
jgi:hypothetical protein